MHLFSSALYAKRSSSASPLWTLGILASFVCLLQGSPVPEHESKEVQALHYLTSSVPVVETASKLDATRKHLPSRLKSSARSYAYLGGHDSIEDEHLAYVSAQIPYYSHLDQSFYNPLAIVAVIAFGFIALILLLQFLGVSIGRSLSSSPGPIPQEFWNASGEIIPELMMKAYDWLENSSWIMSDSVTKTSREKRSPEAAGPGVRDWFRAYRKDPNSYSCIRKLVCETLANSTLAERSVKSPLGGTIMSMLGRAVKHGPEVVDLVTEVVGDPEKCLYFAPNELCN